MVYIDRDTIARAMWQSDTNGNPVPTGAAGDPLFVSGGGSGGGGGGAATVANGADVAEGSTTDAAYSDTTGAAAGSVVSLLKGQYVGQRVMGMAPSGSATVGNPVLFAGTDGTNVRGFRVDTNGRSQNTWYTSGGQEIIYRNDTTNNVAATTSTTMPVMISRQTVYDGSRWQFAAGDTNGAYSVNKGGSNIATGQVAVTTAATLVVAARTGRQKVTLSPTSSTVYYVGATGVTTASGVYVAAGSSVTLDTAAAVYAVGAAAVTISYIEFY